VSGKNNKILPIPETMQVISTSAESKEERSKKTKKKLFGTCLRTKKHELSFCASVFLKYYAKLQGNMHLATQGAHLLN
jgi:hypothetical protein